MKALFTALLLITLTIEAASQGEGKEPPGLRDITVTEAAKELASDKKPLILDIRTPREFAAGHLEGAINIDFMSKDFTEKLAELDRTKRYLIYCRSGVRSAKAMRRFKELEFASILHLKEGYLGWSKKQPTIK